MAHYNLSEEQEQFIEEAESHKLKVEYNYNNNFTKGRNCPAVRVNSLKGQSFNGKSIQWDKDESGFVIYAPF